jgi:hypothetical protein
MQTAQPLVPKPNPFGAEIADEDESEKGTNSRY